MHDMHGDSFLTNVDVVLGDDLVPLLGTVLALLDLLILQAVEVDDLELGEQLVGLLAVVLGLPRLRLVEDVVDVHSRLITVVVFFEEVLSPELQKRWGISNQASLRVTGIYTFK